MEKLEQLYSVCKDRIYNCSVTYQRINDYSVEIYTGHETNYKNIYYTNGHSCITDAIDVALNFLNPKIMKTFVTTVSALCPKTGELKTYCGPHVPGISIEDAKNYCEQNGLGYCKVEGELVAVVEEDRTIIDYDNAQNN